MKTASRWLFALLFATAGGSHFVWTDEFVRVMPPYLPWHEALVYLSGLGEIACGVLLFVPQSVRVAACGAIVLLLAELPPKLHVALHPEEFPEIPPYLVVVALALQPALIAWAYRYTRRGRFSQAIATITSVDPPPSRS